MRTSRMFFLTLLFFTPFLLFAQDGGGGIDIPETFLTYTGLVAAVVFLTEAFKRVSGKSTFLVSVIISTVVCAAAWIFQWGIFIGLLWWHALLYDVGVVLIVKGTVSMDTVLWVLSLFRIAPPAQRK